MFMICVSRIVNVIITEDGLNSLYVLTPGWVRGESVSGCNSVSPSIIVRPGPSTQPTTHTATDRM